MSLVEKLRAITTGLGWIFHYGRRDFQNLVETDDELDAKCYFFLDPVSRKKKYSASGTFSGETDYSGYFMLLTKSDLDEIYDGQKDQNLNDGKWLKHIEPKITALMSSFDEAIVCDDDLQMVFSDITDVINVFDENLDGILVNFTIKQYE
jgi:hypothetical protein